MPSESEDGFATLDAMMALVILAVTVAMALSASRIAVRLSIVIQETRKADRLLGYVMDDGSALAGSAEGRNGEFEWKRSIVETSTQPPRLCQRNVEVRALRSGRTYGFSSAGPCPSGPAASQ